MNTLHIKGLKKICHTNSNWKRARVTKLILDKIVFKIKMYGKYKKRYLIMIKGLTHQKDITVVNPYVPNRTPKHRKQKPHRIDREIRHINNSSLEFEYPTFFFFVCVCMCVCVCVCAVEPYVMHARQSLYPLSYTVNPFVFVLFLRQVLATFARSVFKVTILPSPSLE
jgi:hypothetical protein